MDLLKAQVFASDFAAVLADDVALDPDYRDGLAGYGEAGAFIRCSDLDGIHYEPDQHAILGAAMAEAVRMMLD